MDTATYLRNLADHVERGDLLITSIEEAPPHFVKKQEQVRTLLGVFSVTISQEKHGEILIKTLSIDGGPVGLRE